MVSKDYRWQLIPGYFRWQKIIQLVNFNATYAFFRHKKNLNLIDSCSCSQSIRRFDRVRLPTHRRRVHEPNIEYNKQISYKKIGNFTF
jgi:hypothetical protein